jgi:hypothetical protein
VRRFARFTFNLLSAASAVLCAVLVWFWLSGYVQGWYGRWERKDADLLGHESLDCDISGGGLALTYAGYRILPSEAWFIPPFKASLRNRPEDRFIRRSLSNDYPTPHAWASGHSVYWQTSIDRPYRVRQGLLIVPCWVVVVVAAVLPLIWVLLSKAPQALFRIAWWRFSGFSKGHEPRLSAKMTATRRIVPFLDSRESEGGRDTINGA